VAGVARAPAHDFTAESARMNVQHVFEDDGSDTEDERAYAGVRCLACARIHLVSRKTGRLISDRADG
jgi:hypothetical protein